MNSRRDWKTCLRTETATLIRWLCIELDPGSNQTTNQRPYVGGRSHMVFSEKVVSFSIWFLCLPQVEYDVALQSTFSVLQQHRSVNEQKRTPPRKSTTLLYMVRDSVLKSFHTLHTLFLKAIQHPAYARSIFSLWGARLIYAFRHTTGGGWRDIFDVAAPSWGSPRTIIVAFFGRKNMTQIRRFVYNFVGHINN